MLRHAPVDIRATVPAACGEVPDRSTQRHGFCLRKPHPWHWTGFNVDTSIEGPGRTDADAPPVPQLTGT